MASVKQSSLILYLVILLGMVLGYLYNSQTDPAAEITPVAPNLQLTSLKSLESLKIDYTALQNSQFQALRTFGELPVRTEQGGDQNPFQ